MIQTLHYHISEVSPYINWLYFYHSWGLTGKPESEKLKLRAEAERMLRSMEETYLTHVVFGIFDANSDGDDLLLADVRIPMLRQQKSVPDGTPYLCLADFVKPLAMGEKDKVGAFAAATDMDMEKAYKGDAYRQMMAQTLAERLAEATTERMHLEVRRTYWGYAPHEQLPIDELHREAYQGIRPAIGYPSLPDTSVNFLLADLLDTKKIGIRLTESGMMQPHASVSGLMFAHPQARYFELGPIGEDQLRDYARRRDIPVELMRRFLSSSLLKR